jgi:plastocyanin
MRPIASTIALLALAALLAACSGADAAPNPTGPAATPDPDALTISSKDLKFSSDTLQATANKPFTIVYENREGAPHNVAIYRDSTMKEQVFAEDPFSGPRTVTYEVPALAAGTYYFVCDLHRNMNGTLVVQ